MREHRERGGYIVVVCCCLLLLCVVVVCCCLCVGSEFLHSFLNLQFHLAYLFFMGLDVV